jgi:cytochrome c oxidase assembly factor CtaG
MLGAASATPGLWDWSVDPALVAVILVGILYRIGDRRTVAPERTRRERRWRAASFYAGLATVVLALNSPLDALSAQLFWAHMVQHVLLLVVAPPLIILARPWIRLWRSLPLSTRQSLGHGLGQGPRAAPLRSLSRTLGRPTASFLLFSTVLLVWHVPALFDATLRSSLVHALEHTLFFSTALLFWKQVLPSPPLRARLVPLQRVGYLVGAMVVSWILAIVLALEPHPLYAHYAHEATRLGGISALADQQLAAGIMWVPGSITFLIVMFAYVHRWLTPTAPGTARAGRLAGEH